MRSRNLVLFTISLIVLTSVVVYSADAAGIPKKAISTVARFLESDLPTTSVFTDQASTYTAGKQTFVASSSGSAGVNIPTGSDPTTPAQGDIWLNSDILKYRGTSTHSLITSAVTSINSDVSAAQTIQGVSGNTSASTSAGTTTINTGSNVVVIGGSAQTISKQLTINSGVLGGNLNVGSNAFSNSGHLITIPTNTGTVLLTNGSGSSLTNIVTSITGTANNLTSSTSTGAVTLNLGSNVVTTGGSAQIFTKNMTLPNPKINGINLNYSKTIATNLSLNSKGGVIIASTTAGNVTMLLPATAGTTGQLFIIQRNDTGSGSHNSIFIKPTGSEKIDGSSNLNITRNQETVFLQSTGIGYTVLQDTSYGQDNTYLVKGTTFNRWYNGAVTQIALTNALTQTAAIQVYPMRLGATTTFDRIEVDVNALLAASTCRMGIYTDNGNSYPLKLVTGSDGGTVSGAAVARVGNTFASPITLTPGLYWLASQCSTAATLKLVTIPVGGVDNVLGYSSVSGSAAGTGWTIARAYAAFPATYPGGGTIITSAPYAVFLRAIG